MKRLPVLLTLLAGMLMLPGLFVVRAENHLNLRLSDGSVRVINLADLSKLTFSGETMTASLKDAGDEIFSFSQFNQFAFALNASGVEYATVLGLCVYPCPASDQITLANIPENASRAVFYNLEGRIVLQIQLSASECSVDISTFQKGLYLVRIGSKTVKFSKI